MLVVSFTTVTKYPVKVPSTRKALVWLMVQETQFTTRKALVWLTVQETQSTMRKALVWLMVQETHSIWL